ncbi:MAG TPA: FtsX-like permease family protein [Micromonosporaceae bacterium]
MLRATLKSLLSRKVRLLLSGLAVLLGVMFVSGAFVLTDTLSRSFDSLFATAFSGVDVQVSGASPVVAEGDRQAEPPVVPADLVDRIKAVPGVGDATGVVQADGARIVGRNGKVVTTFGAPRFGRNWTGTSGLVELRSGQGPSHDDEIAINAGLAATTGYHVGDRVGVLTLQPKRTFTIVGIFGYSGGRDSLGGEQTIAFTTPAAQRLMLGEPDVYSEIDVTAAPGVRDTVLRDRLAAALGSGYDVKTGAQLAAQQSQNFRDNLKFFNYVLLGFAGVALFVGVFLIFNTFSIIVAQRTRELALLRALGASRRQMIGSVLVEAIVIGLIASVLGLAAGVGVGALLAYVFGHTGGANLHLAGIGVPAAAVISAFAVGVGITLIAAFLPALRASRVAPVAAMREAATWDRPLTRITAAGGGVTVVGVGLLVLGLSGRAHGSTLPAILAGVLLAFLGIALLTPIISRPVVGVLGRLFARSVPGQLGRRNSARNPRRTAITAAALMVGIALITGVSVILSSATASITRIANQQVKAELVVAGDNAGPRMATFDKAALDAMPTLPGVREVAGFFVDAGLVDGKRTTLEAVNDPAAMRDIFSLSATGGSLDRLAPGQALVDEKTATDQGLHVGSTVRVQTARGDARDYTISGVYAKSDLLRGWILPGSAAAGFRVAQPTQALIRVQPGASVPQVQSRVDALLADSPEVTVSSRADFVKQQTSRFDVVLTMIQILLALAILIAVLGIVNTLALSVIERTRELGVLRAVGLRRGQVMRMVTVEAVVIAVFGALLGVVVGVGLGAAVVRALRDQGFTDLALPWGQMGGYLVLAAIIGVVAAVLPAIRAARVNVLAAIAYE